MVRMNDVTFLQDFLEILKRRNVSNLQRQTTVPPTVKGLNSITSHVASHFALTKPFHNGEHHILNI